MRSGLISLSIYSSKSLFKKTEPAPTNGSIKRVAAGKRALICSVKEYLPPAHLRKALFFYSSLNRKSSTVAPLTSETKIR